MGAGQGDWQEERWEALREQSSAQIAKILNLMEQLDQCHERIELLVADNRRLRLALGHERPMLAVVRREDVMA